MSSEQCSDVHKWNKTELAVQKLLSIGVTALLFPIQISLLSTSSSPSTSR